MATVRTLVCPDPRHFQERSVGNASQAASKAARMILEGQCPACHEPLQEMMDKRFGGARYGLCPCCHGRFRAWGDGKGISYNIELPSNCRLEERWVASSAMTI